MSMFYEAPPNTPEEKRSEMIWDIIVKFVIIVPFVIILILLTLEDRENDRNVELCGRIHCEIQEGDSP